MKRILPFFIFFLICSTCLAADTITAEIESNNIKSYCSKDQGYSYYNSFVKCAAPNPEQDAVYKEYCARQNFHEDLEERRNDV